MSVRISTAAFCRAVVARMTIRDPELGGAIKTSCSWELLEPPGVSPSPTREGEGTEASFPAGRNNKHAASIRQQLLAAESFGLAGDYEHGVATRGAQRRSQEIVKRCRMHGILYVDQDFPPNDSSLGPSLAASGLLTWCRPANLATAAAATSAFGGYGRPLPSDVRACPFAVDASLPCALAALAERPRLVSAALCGRVEEMVAMAASASSGSGGGSGGGDGDGVGGGGGGCGGQGLLDKNGRPYRGGEGGGIKDKRRTPPKHAKAGLAPTAAEAAAKASASAANSGMFSARLCVDGVWTEYIMDDYFPCISAPGGGGCGSGGLCLSRAHGPALWVSMLEKAYARATGSYSAVLRGHCLSSEEESRGDAVRVAASAIARPAEVLGVFTGAPVLQVEIVGGKRRTGGVEAMEVEGADGGDETEQAAGELWRNVVSWIQQGWLVCLSTRPVPYPVESPTGVQSRGGSHGPWKDGLRLGYAYTVLQAAEVGGGNKLFRLRGPLPAKEGWRGVWADDSPGWTPEALSSLRSASPSGEPTSAEEERGAFWVSVREAVSAFVEVGVCMASSPPPPARESSSGGRSLRRKEKTTGGSGSGSGSGWVQEARRRVVFARVRAQTEPGGGCMRDDLAAMQRNTAAVNGRKRDKNGESGEGTRWCWASPQVYALSVYETSSMFFSAHQKTCADEPEGFYRDVGVTVLRLREGCQPEAIASTGNPAQAVASAGAVLTPGRYVVVPSCAGCTVGDSRENGYSEASPRKARLLGMMTRRGSPWRSLGGGDDSICRFESRKATVTETRWEEEEEEEEDEEDESSFDCPDVLSGLKDMFWGLDADCDGVLSREELDAFLRTTEGLPLQDDVYTWLVRAFSSCPRPPNIANASSYCDNYENRRRGGANGQRHRQRWGRRAPAGTESCGNSSSGMNRCGGGDDHGGAESEDLDLDLDLCLTWRGFVEMYRRIWLAAGKDIEVVTRDLLFAGCITTTTPHPGGKRLISMEQRLSAVVSVHSDTAGFDLLAQPQHPGLLEAARILPVKRWGYSLTPRPECGTKKAAPPGLVRGSDNNGHVHVHVHNHNNSNDKDDDNNDDDSIDNKDEEDDDDERPQQQQQQHQQRRENQQVLR
ncbi:unnamed protein product [Pylaiella littoralis]